MAAAQLVRAAWRARLGMHGRCPAVCCCSSLTSHTAPCVGCSERLTNAAKACRQGSGSRVSSIQTAEGARASGCLACTCCSTT